MLIVPDLANGRRSTPSQLYHLSYSEPTETRIIWFEAQPALPGHVTPASATIWGNSDNCAWRGAWKYWHETLPVACVSVEHSLWPGPGAVRARTGQHRLRGAGCPPREEPAPRDAPREGSLWWSQLCPMRSGRRVCLAAARQENRAHADFFRGFRPATALYPLPRHPRRRDSGPRPRGATTYCGQRRPSTGASHSLVRRWRFSPPSIAFDWLPEDGRGRVDAPDLASGRGSAH